MRNISSILMKRILKGAYLLNDNIIYIKMFETFNLQFIHIMVGEYLAMDAYKLQKPWIVIDSRIKKGE